MSNKTEQTSEEELATILTSHKFRITSVVFDGPQKYYQMESSELQALIPKLIAWKDAAVVEARKEERLAAESDFGFTEEDEQHQRELCKAIESKGVVYMSLQTGRVITEEAYWEFREWVDAVGKPEGSVVEQHLKIDIAQLNLKEK